MTNGKTGATVLAVDDEAEIAELYASWLEDTYDVRTAYSGEEALEMLDEGLDADVILLDRRMPDLSGDEVLEEIRARGIDAQVVMATAVDPDVDVIWMDFDDYLVKPIERDRLRDIVASQFVRRAYQEPIQEYLRLVTKRRTIEQAGSDGPDEDYEELIEEIERLRPQVEEIIGELTENEIVALGLRDFWVNSETESS